MARPRVGTDYPTTVAASLGVLLALVGVSAGDPVSPATVGQPAAVELATSTLRIGESIGGRPMHCHVLGDGPDVLLVIATIHGNESAGTPLVEAFRKWLIANPDELAGRQVVIVPVANPDGMAVASRHNARGVDLNRNFSAGNWKRAKADLHGATPLSEPETRALMRVVCQYFPQRVISIHQPEACVDYDGPAGELAGAMAAACLLPVQRIGSRPGSLGSFVGNTLHRPIITLELPRNAAQDGEELFHAYGPALVAALRFTPQPSANPSLAE